MRISDWSSDVCSSDLVDYDMTMPSPPDASGIAGDNVWDSGKWGSSSWGDVTPSSITQQWESLSGLGYTCSISFQVTSGTSRSEEHTSELQSLMRISYAVFCLTKKKKQKTK